MTEKKFFEFCKKNSTANQKEITDAWKDICKKESDCDLSLAWLPKICIDIDLYKGQKNYVVSVFDTNNCGLAAHLCFRP